MVEFVKVEVGWESDIKGVLKTFESLGREVPDFDEIQNLWVEFHADGRIFLQALCSDGKGNRLYKTMEA